MKAKKNSGKLTAHTGTDLPPRKVQDVKGGAVNAFLTFFDKVDGESIQKGR